MRIRRRQLNSKQSAFNIPLAGFCLSAVTFVLGTLVPTIYNQLTFSGIAVKQPSDVRVINSSVTGLTPLDSTSKRVAFSTLLKVANANKDAALLENIEGESFFSGGTYFEFLDADVSQIEVDSNGKFKYELPPKADAGNPTSQLPLLLKPESQQVLVISLWYKIDASNTADATALSNRFSAYVDTSNLKISLQLSGKQRDYSLQAGPWSRYQQDRPDPTPLEHMRRQLEYLRDTVPKEDHDTRRKVEEALKKIQNSSSSY